MMYLSLVCFVLSFAVQGANGSHLVMENKLRIERGFVSDEAAHGVLKGIRDGILPYPGDFISDRLLTVNGDGGEKVRFSSTRDLVQTFRDIINEETEGKTSGILRLQEIKRADYDFAKNLVNTAVENSVMEDGGTIHLYLSSPGSAALANHTDVTDIFVLQLVGSKEWILCDSGASMLLDKNLRGKLDKCVTYTAAEMDNLYCESTTLYAGDALYLPKQVVHSARATNEGLSAHLTFGFADNTCSVDEIDSCITPGSPAYGQQRRFLCQSNQGGTSCDCSCDSWFGTSSCDNCCNSNCPTPNPTRPPTRPPTPRPTPAPSAMPSMEPSVLPSSAPTIALSGVPTKLPTPPPTPGPTPPLHQGRPIHQHQVLRRHQLHRLLINHL